MLKNPDPVVSERIRECMKLGLGSNKERYDEELGKLVDEFGPDFVSQHACEETWFGGQECPPGHCKRPEGYSEFDSEDECTCRQACLAYIEAFIGVRCTN